MSTAPAFSPGPLDDARAGGRQRLQVHARALVAAVLGPHHREHAELGQVRLAAEQLPDAVVFAGGDAVSVEGGGVEGHRVGCVRSGQRALRIITMARPRSRMPAGEERAGDEGPRVRAQPENGSASFQNASEQREHDDRRSTSRIRPTAAGAAARRSAVIVPPPARRRAARRRPNRARPCRRRCRAPARRRAPGAASAPTTLRRSLQMPAMLWSDPFGLAASVVSPAAVT